MSLEYFDVVYNRLSDASTTDLDYTEKDKGFSKFTNISGEIASMYEGLGNRLKDLLEVLEHEIEAICVREEKVVKAKPVCLNGIQRSNMLRRRTVV